ncbi:MAG: thioesterase family protein [Gammaproteobacteria bacterium]|jgi:acyl-CoA thioester hydrolase|nr:thioesterase family protein [Gammaproteobacteria bacterium]MBU1489541.1 thioesterase family protein [Gammaproteobacteria bacterium]MBU2067040.1 thioesterase family protein [Gammaproteobacteria bacterium]MBU2139698.1 thioesterase family protein [Gammaproteobacteria bacterium]MBU2215507.1 thioesterase family protein [Gammaproteobacteria bacterium]
MPATYQTRVSPAWVDYNGHLRDAFYLLIFSHATDALMDQLGLDEAGRARTGHTLYTLECHLNFLAEVKEGEAVEVRTQLLAHDRKRLHIHHSLHCPGEDISLAQSEQMLMNIDTATGRSAVFDTAVAQRVQQLADAQRDWPAPEYVQRLIGMPPAK